MIADGCTIRPDGRYLGLAVSADLVEAYDTSSTTESGPMEPGEQIVARGRHLGHLGACPILRRLLWPRHADRALRDLIPAVRRGLHNEQHLVNLIGEERVMRKSRAEAVLIFSLALLISTSAMAAPTKGDQERQEIRKMAQGS